MSGSEENLLHSDSINEHDSDTNLEASSTNEIYRKHPPYKEPSRVFTLRNMLFALGITALLAVIAFAITAVLILTVPPVGAFFAALPLIGAIATLTSPVAAAAAFAGIVAGVTAIGGVMAAMAAGIGAKIAQLWDRNAGFEPKDPLLEDASPSEEAVALNSANQEIRQLREQLSTASQRIQQLEVNNRELQTSKSQLEDANAEILELKQQVSKVGDLQGQLDQVQQENFSLTASLNGATQNVEALTSQIGELTAQLTQLKDKPSTKPLPRSNSNPSFFSSDDSGTGINLTKIDTKDESPEAAPSTSPRPQ